MADESSYGVDNDAHVDDDEYIDARARRLLGWRDDDVECRDDDDDVGTATTDATTRTTTSMIVRRAMALLSGEEGIIDFSPNNDDNSSNPVGGGGGGGGGGGCRSIRIIRDPTSIVAGYHRLVARCLLLGIEDGTMTKLACEVLKRANDSLSSAMRAAAAVGAAMPSSSSSSSSGAPSPPAPPSASAASTSTTAATAATMADLALGHLRYVLRDVHPRVASDYRLLGPAYRGFGEVAEVLVVASRYSSGSGGEDVDAARGRGDRIASTLERASALLLCLLDDVLDSVETTLLRGIGIGIGIGGAANGGGDGGCDDCCRRGEANTWSRLIVFLLARATSLSSMAARARRRRRRRGGRTSSSSSSLSFGTEARDDGGAPSRGEEEEEEEEDAAIVLGPLVRRLARVMSVSLLAESISSPPEYEEADEDASVIDDGGRRRRDGGGGGGVRVELSDMARELRLKTELHLTRVLGFGLGGDAIASPPAVAVGRVLECLADPPPPSRDGGGDDDDVPPYDALGRLLLAKHAMERTLVSDSAAIVLPDPRIVVDLVESVIFVDVPRCHRLVRCSSSPPSSSSTSSAVAMVRDHLRRRAMETLSDLVRVLEGASHALCLSGESDDVRSMRRYRRQRSIIRQHHLLVRWLAPAGSSSARCRDRVEHNHPLTNEVLLHILQRRVMISCSVDDDYSREDASHLISLLSELLFHRQTEVSHRRNIATLLIRLLSASSDGAHANVQTDARRLARESLWACLKNSGAINPTRRKKRKRSDATRSSLLPPDDVRTICSVLESLAKSGSIDGDASGGMRHFWQEVLSNNLGRVRGGGREVDRVAFVLSLSVGAARASSTLAAFFIAFDSDGILSGGNTSPDSFVGSFLNFVAAHRINGRSKTDDSAGRGVILQSVCIGLIVALSGCVGRDMPEAQFHRIAEILNDSAASASADASVHAIGLRYITVNAASNMGNLIRSDFNERSLKVCLVSRLRLFPTIICCQRQRITVG